MRVATIMWKAVFVLLCVLLDFFFLLGIVSAQQVSPVLVREASTPKMSSTETFALMMAAPVKVWRVGDPIRVKGDLKGRDDPSVLRVPSRSRPDPLLRRASSAT